jgi:hypothetical protein
MHRSVFELQRQCALHKVGLTPSSLTVAVCTFEVTHLAIASMPGMPWFLMIEPSARASPWCGIPAGDKMAV